MMTLAQRFDEVRERIAAASNRSGRDESQVTLVAVSKTFPLERIMALHELGQVDFGENKAQELVTKASQLPGSWGGGPVRWHAIGHLQRNKAKDVVACADLFHALDSDRLAAELDRRCEAAGRRLSCLVQVNVSAEQTKQGLQPEDVYRFLQGMEAYRSLDVAGLMTLAAPADDPEDVRPQFRTMRRLFEEWHDPSGRIGLTVLSMGMSGDYEVAIEEGATHVRVGSAIFGERPYP